jgi:cytochrome c peroxidase
MARVLALASIPLLCLACGPGSGARAALPVGQPGTFPLEEVRLRVKDPALHVAFVPAAPLGITTPLATRIPPDNPLTRAKVELGLQLFFDPRLSASGELACASCHHPTLGWAGGAPRAGRRSAPALTNRLLGAAQHWDGRAATLEEQALAALADPTQLGAAPVETAARLNAIEGYRLQFEAVFGAPASPERVARALAAFERTLTGGNSRHDVHTRALPVLGRTPDDGFEPPLTEADQAALAAEARDPLSEAALRGRELFLGPARCAACHAGENLTDERFHNLGLGLAAREPDLGRTLVTGREEDRGAFKTPSLRNVALTAPYMHDGSLATLRAVVEHYERGGVANPWLSPALAPLGLSEQQKQDLVAFLEEGLTGQGDPVTVPRLP